MAITINGSGTITGISAGGLPDGSVTAADIASLPAGSVLQVVQGGTNTSTAITSTSYQDTTLSASITPTNSSSKILIIVSQAGHVYATTSSNRWAYMRIMRDSTEVHAVTQALGGRGALSGDRSDTASVSLTYLDSPSSTSTLTYKTQAKINDSASANYTAQVSESESTITLMEIAG